MTGQAIDTFPSLNCPGNGAVDGMAIQCLDDALLCRVSQVARGCAKVINVSKRAAYCNMISAASIKAKNSLAARTSGCNAMTETS